MKKYIDWKCDECGETARSPNTPAYQGLAPAGQRKKLMHVCPKLRGLSVAMTRAGQSTHVVLNEREDYVAGENVQLDPEERRPVMNIETRYDDGHTDLVVLAPSATTSANARR